MEVTEKVARKKKKDGEKDKGKRRKMMKRRKEKDKSYNEKPTKITNDEKKIT